MILCLSCTKRNHPIDTSKKIKNKTKIKALRLISLSCLIQAMMMMILVTLKISKMPQKPRKNQTRIMLIRVRIVTILAPLRILIRKMRSS